jgi:hypothetical protein
MSEYYEFGNAKWRVYKGILEPVLIKELDVDCSKAKRWMENTGAFMVRWVKSLSNSFTPLWYNVQLKAYSIEDYSRNTRSKIRRGLKNFYLNKMLRDSFIALGYDVYRSVSVNDRGEKPLEYEMFAAHISNLPSETDIWGIFDRNSNDLDGYALVYNDEGQAHLHSIMILPRAKRRYASYAFFYKMNEYYLANGRAGMLVLGLRNLLHQTNIEKFVSEQFFYTQMFVRFGICMKPYVRKLYKAVFPLRNMLKYLPWQKAKSLSALIKFIYLCENF